MHTTRQITVRWRSAWARTWCGCRIYAATTLWLLGTRGKPGRLHESLALAHELSHPFSLAWAWCGGHLFKVRRDVPAVYEQADAAVTLSTEQGFHSGRRE